MNKAKVETITFVNGTPVDAISNEKLIHHVNVLEAEIASLGKMKTKSKTVDALKVKYQENIDEIVALLDAREVK